jgi:hypothetical protein
MHNLAHLNLHYTPHMARIVRNRHIDPKEVINTGSSWTHLACTVVERIGLEQAMLSMSSH